MRHGIESSVLGAAVAVEVQAAVAKAKTKAASAVRAAKATKGLRRSPRKVQELTMVPWCMAQQHLPTSCIRMPALKEKATDSNDCTLIKAPLNTNLAAEAGTAMCGGGASSIGGG
jgi:hypothetical protein